MEDEVMRTPTARTELLLRIARSCPPGEVVALIGELLDAAGLDRDERVEVLGGALVAEAVRPYWIEGCNAEEAHAELQVEDPELSEAVEAISPMLLGRAKAREESRDAIRDLEAMLQG
jgi:hypothetical protein